MDKMKPLCIWHGGCLDGFTAAWVVRQFFGPDGVEFHAGVYQTEPPDVTGRDVIMVDFSYKRRVIEEMAEKARSILILDHHKSARDDLAGFLAAPNVGIYGVVTHPDSAPRSAAIRTMVIFDMERSGAGMTWDYFFPDEEGARPTLINHVEDHDLWRFRMSGTREIVAALYSYDFEFDVWNTLVKRCDDDEDSELFGEGCAILRQKEKNVTSLSKHARRMTINGHDVPVVNAPYFLASDLGNLLAKGEPFAATYQDFPDGRTFSLRSAEDGLDVSKIAETFGGGGHAHAAGFKVFHGHVFGEEQF